MMIITIYTRNLEVLGAMEIIKQPELVATEKKEANIIASTNNLSLNTLVAPISV